MYSLLHGTQTPAGAWLARNSRVQLGTHLGPTRLNEWIRVAPTRLASPHLAATLDEHHANEVIELSQCTESALFQGPST